MEDKNKNNKDERTHYFPLGMCLGLSIGTAIGSATGNMGTSMLSGLSIGMCIGLALDSLHRRDGEDSSKTGGEDEEE